MIIDAYTKAIEKDIAKTTLLKIILIIIGIVIGIMFIIVEISHYMALFRIKKEMIKIREILEDSPLNKEE